VIVSGVAIENCIEAEGTVPEILTSDESKMTYLEVAALEREAAYRESLIASVTFDETGKDFYARYLFYLVHAGLLLVVLTVLAHLFVQ
jgi:hypothetical protein